MKKLISALLAIVFCFESSAFAFNSQSIEEHWPAENRPNMRSKMLEPLVFLTPVDENGKKDDSVGVPIASDDPKDVRAALEYVIQTRGREKLIGTVLFITGVGIGDEEYKRAEYKQIVRDLGFREDELKIHILSVPKEDVTKMLGDAFQNLMAKLQLVEEPAPGETPTPSQVLKAILARTDYFLPSAERDYQDPIRREIFAGLASQVLVEAPVYGFSIYMLKDFKKASLLAAGNFAVLALYAVFMKSMTNWLLHPGSTGYEKFTKNVMVGLPFTITYEVLNNINQFKISEFRKRGFENSMKGLGKHSAEWVARMGITTVIQSAFYDLVITRGVRQWEQSYKGVKDSQDVRVVSKLVMTPLLWIDSVLFLAAIIGKTPWGPIPLLPGRISKALGLNYAHASLAAYTAMGSYLAYNPAVLDHTLNFARRHRQLLQALYMWPVDDQEEKPAPINFSSGLTKPKSGTHRTIR